MLKEYFSLHRPPAFNSTSSGFQTNRFSLLRRRNLPNFSPHLWDAQFFRCGHRDHKAKRLSQFIAARRRVKSCPEKTCELRNREPRAAFMLSELVPEVWSYLFSMGAISLKTSWATILLPSPLG